jgi:ABC-type multidrug transport system ATPase subunit
VLDQLLYYRQGKTTIMISHRPKVIQRADWVVLLEQGRLKIQGSPEELGRISGDHLDFLGVALSPKSWMVKSSRSDSNGKSPAISQL